MLNGLSLFSGYGGIDLALGDYIRPIMYCEIERYAQGIILSAFDKGVLPVGVVWNDVTTLDGNALKGLVDIVYGGFPCQDISVAGKGAGLEGERSGLFREIIRICTEASPQFIFLENVPAIRTRGSIEVQEALAGIGYDTRWLTLSAAEVGANHKRERWFCLATNTKCELIWEQPGRRSGQDGQSQALARNDGETRLLADSDCVRELPKQRQHDRTSDCGKNMAHSSGERLERQRESERISAQESGPDSIADAVSADYLESKWWQTEPNVGRVANGIAFRPHRIKALGNGVVPLQVKTAFEILMGIN
jgi:DNA (cytosine-5)-methyltransferase 1